MKKVLSLKYFVPIELVLIFLTAIGFLMQRQGLFTETFGVCSSAQGRLQVVLFCSVIISKILFNIIGSLALTYFFIFAVSFLFKRFDQEKPS